YEKLGIPGELTDTIPIDLDVKKAVIMRDQAQFHPVKFISHLAEKVEEMGGHIFENTTAVNIDEGEQPVVLTRGEHRVTAKHVLACSHFPFYEGLGLYSTRMYAERSYVLAAKTKQDFPDGIFISADKP